jgi:co-chaperonin GroES (HSP10)
MLRPIKKNVILKVIEKEKVSKGGIIMADVDREEASKGTVFAIGSDVTLVEVDQIVLPNWQKAKKSKFEDQDFWIVDEDDIILIFEGGE